MKYIVLAIAVALAIPSRAANQLEKPAGFISESNGGFVTPQGMKTPITAKPGDFLFLGDKLSGAAGSITFFVCLEKGDGYRVILSQPMEVTSLPPADTHARVAVCSLPQVERWPNVAVIPDLRNQLGAREGIKQSIDALPDGTGDTLKKLSSGDLTDPRLKLAFAVQLQEHGLLQDAAWQYLDLSETWPSQPRLRKLAFDLAQNPSGKREIVHPGGAPDARPEIGKIFALVVGISKYEQNTIPDLQFAANDAKEFAAYLRTKRGAATEVYELTDGQATSGAIRQTFNKLYAKAGPRDSIILLVAAHGDMDPVRGTPMVITHRADPQDLTINSFPMSELQQWLLGKKTPFGQASVFLDVCHAGRFAQFTPGDGKNYFFLLATRPVPNAFAYESAILKTCPACQGDESRREGHGAFTYFLLRGLNTQEAKDPGSQFITREGLADYVSDNVYRITNKKQKPTDLSDSKSEPRLADLNEPGLNPFDTPDLSKLNIYSQQEPARRGHRALPPKLGPSPPVQDYPRDLAKTIDIENRGETALLRYLKGDEIALSEKDFQDCRNAFNALLVAEPGSPYLGARSAFCEGRAEIFQATREKADAQRNKISQSQDHSEAVGKSAEGFLEQAIRLDPGAAYPYNALGILWLERSRYDLARAAFEDAIHWAPQWAYPRHNLALTLVQSGEYDAAISTYKEAMSLAPQLFYLPYSLGLVYQRMNRLDEADAAYHRASMLAPTRPEPYTGVGAVHALRGEWKQAETSFRKALQQPLPLPIAVQAARHNLAMILARHSGASEALTLWKQNAGYLPSELSLAEYLKESAGRLHWRDGTANSAAVDQYRAVLAWSGGELHIRMSLADVLERAGRIDEAISENQAIAAQDVNNVEAIMKLGDLFSIANRGAEACEAYHRVLAMNAQSSIRKRVLQKVRACKPVQRQ